MKRSSMNWQRLRAMTEKEIEAAAAADRDNPPLSVRELSNFTVVWPGPKKAVSIRLDEDVIAWFKAQGPGYQSRINAVLKHFVAAQKAVGGRQKTESRGRRRN